MNIEIALSLLGSLSLPTAMASLVIHSSPSAVASRSNVHMTRLAAVDSSVFFAEAITERGIATGPFCIYVSRLEYHDSEKIGYDVSSARSWLEHIEQSDGPLFGVGAYTVIRCDYARQKQECKWKVWGLDFHTDRLCSSYRMLMQSVGSDFNDDAKSITIQRIVGVINALLKESTRSLIDASIEETKHDYLASADLSRTLILTVLVTPSRIDTHSNETETNSMKSITIRGHATFADATLAQTLIDDALPAPISVCLAIPIDPTAEAMSQLPRRHHQSHDHVPPTAKISSWCRIRRPLEDPIRYKVHGVGEVLLVNNHLKSGEHSFVDSLEILEGLTSNVFVIYKDGTVRTAQLPKVLPGFARHLVLDALDRVNGLVLDTSSAPTVHDAKAGLWSEVFVTSAIKLIVPVNRILIPSIGIGQEPTTLWQSNFDPKNHSFTRLIQSEVRGLGGRSSPVPGL